MKFRILIQIDEDGMYIVQCPTLPGCVPQGKTRAEALAHLKDAIQGYLLSLKKHNEASTSLLSPARIFAN